MGEKPTRPIKVLHIIARMNVGGPAVEITELMRGLDPNVISQRLVTGYCNDDEADFLETQAPDISATRIDGLGRSIKPTDDARAFAQLVKLMRSSRPDIVHTHTAKAGVLGRLAAKFSGTGTRIVHTYHGHLLYGYFGPHKTQAWIEMEKRLASITNCLITVGEKIQQELLRAGIGKHEQYRTIRFGLQTKELPSKRAAREILGLDQDVRVVSMISRLTQVKRPDRFLDVAQHVIRQVAGVEFLIAGGGDLEKEIENEVRRRGLPVHMLGWRSDPETVMAATDILLIPSDNEGIPLVALEAIRAGIPIVATAVGSMAEVIKQGLTGVLTDPDAETMAHHVVRLLSDPSHGSSADTSTLELEIPSSSVESFLMQHGRAYRALLVNRVPQLDE